MGSRIYCYFMNEELRKQKTGKKSISFGLIFNYGICQQAINIFN